MLERLAVAAAERPTRAHAATATVREVRCKVRITSTFGSPSGGGSEQSKTDTCDDAPLARDMPVLKRNRLHRGEKDKLRHLIEGPVAAMTADQLSVDLDTGLEIHPRYQPAINALRELVLQPGTRLDHLLSCLERALPAHSPPPVKVLAVEAVARQLGREWTEDASSFIDVTIASTRLQDLAQALSIQAAGRSSAQAQPFAAILMPRDEQHSLMSYLTGAFFQAFGWHHQVLSHDQVMHAQVADVVKRADAVCIGWSNIRLRPQVSQLIADIRLHRPAKNQPLIAGGIAALDSVDILVEMGIDCVCDTAYSAVKIADSFNNLEKMKFVPPSVRNLQNAKQKRIDWQSP